METINAGAQDIEHSLRGLLAYIGDDPEREALWKRFNATACRGKNWLPGE